jgi:hypothetical protein
MAWSLAGAALLLALGQGVATAATITVTTNNPNIAADGQCSLIEAIVNANNDAATHADCAAGSGADTIVLPANANVTLSAVYGTTYAQFSPVGLPPIASRITIEGNGAIIARQANTPTFGLIAVRRSSGDLTLQTVTLRGGSSFGGLSNRGTLSIKNSIISAIRAAFLTGAPSPLKAAPSQAIRLLVYLIMVLSLSRTVPSQAIQPLTVLAYTTMEALPLSKTALSRATGPTWVVAAYITVPAGD